MKKLSIHTAALFVLAAGAIGVQGQTAADDDAVRVYPAPDGEPLSTRFTVSVANQNAPAYVAKVMIIPNPATPAVQQSGEAAFASFDMGIAPVSVTVTCPDLVQSAVVLPVSSSVTPQISGKTVTFTVAHPEQLTVEVNGDWNNSLHVFADPVETDVPDPNDPNVIYFGPGVHQVNTINVGSGKTVYISGGAVVYGKATAAPVFSLIGSNITLRGRGIIDGSLFPKPPGANIIYFRGTNLKIEGVILRDSGSWTFTINQSDGVKVENIKEFGWRLNSDGMDINGSRNVDVSDCFLRVFDDLIVIKTFTKGGGESRNITVKHCVLWNQLAHALSIGAEIRDDVENVTFSGCDIIHDKGREWLLRVYDCDSGTVKNITFDNIRVEEARRLISLWIGKAIWSAEKERGHIENITFSHITSTVPGMKSAALVGFDADHAIHGVTFDTVSLGGHPLGTNDVEQNGFVDGVNCYKRRSKNEAVSGAVEK